MPTRDVAAQFDQISAVYDETRDPLDPDTVDRLSDALRASGVRSILEVGVGTGRVARPLLDRGFEVTGLDASAGMMERARAKGVDRLVRGSGYRLPFEDGAFDATLFVHVLHVLDDPGAAIREATRVGRRGAFALVHPRSEEAADGGRREEEPRRIVRQILEEQGFPMTPRSSPWVKERDLLTQLPPDSLRVVREADVTETLRSRLDRLARRGQRRLLAVPPEVLARAIAIARDRVGERTVTYHRVEALAEWSPARGEPVAAPASV